MDESAGGKDRANAWAERVTIVIITALPSEHAAVKSMLDNPVSHTPPGRQGRTYELGTIPGKSGTTHHVALLLVDQGNTSAAVRTALAFEDYTSSTVALMVGIAGGVPYPENPEVHVRLGDVVVSGLGGVVEYDFGKEHQEYFEVRASPRPPSAMMHAAARRLEAACLEGHRTWEDQVKRAKALGVQRPGLATDKLARTPKTQGANQARRPRRTWVEHPDDNDRPTSDSIRVFSGTVGSADRLQKNARHRDALREKFEVRAIEMEGAGVAQAAWELNRSYFIVRGICDYCDEHKNKVWQAYAAIAAAAYARALLIETEAAEPTASSLGSAATVALFREESQTHFAATQSIGTKFPFAVLDFGSVLEGEHQAALEAVRTLLKDGEPELALKQLVAFKLRVWETATSLIRGRTLRLCGHANYEIGNYDEAGRSFVAALSETPEDPKTQANAALGHLLLGNTDAALAWARKAIVSDPTDLTARQVLVLLDGSDDETTLLEHERFVGKSAEIYAALGHRAVRRENIEAAVRWFGLAHQLDPANSEIAGQAGHFQVERLTRNADRSRVPGTAPDVREHDVLRAALVAVQGAWDRLKHDLVRRSHLHWLVSLVNAKRLLGDLQGAAVDSEAALRIGNGNADLVRLRAMVAMEMGDNKKVVSLLDGAPDQSPDTLGLLAASKANLGDYEAAASAVLALLNVTGLPDEVRVQAEHNCVMILIGAKREEQARGFIEQLLNEEQPRLVLGRCVLGAEAAVRLNDQRWRDELLERALALASDKSPHEQLSRLGTALMHAAKYVDASNIYCLFVNVESNVQDVRRLVHALYRAGRYALALEWCQRARSDADPLIFTDVEVAIHEERGDLHAARSACEAFLQAHAENVSMQVRYGLVLLGLGDKSSLVALLNRLSLDAVIQDFALANNYALLLKHSDMPKEALEAYYQLRRVHFDSPDAHALYLSNHDLVRTSAEPASVTVGVAVRLEGTDAPKDWQLLVAESEKRLRPGDLGVSSVVGAALLGKNVGDALTFESAPHRRWTIAELRSKYSFAYGQSLTQFGAMFPSDGRIEARTFTDVDSFRAQLAARMGPVEAQRRNILAKYGEGGMITVGMVGAVLGCDQLKCIGIVLESEHGLIACSNTIDEKQLAARALEPSDVTLVVDFSAIVILDMLGLLTESAAGRKFEITRSTLDVLTNLALQAKQRPETESLSLGTNNGELVGTSLTADDVRRERDHFGALLNWAQTHCSVQAVSAATAERHADKRTLMDNLGKCYWDSVLLASEPGRILLSDDFRLRIIAQGLFGATGVASVYLLMAQQQAGRIDRETLAVAQVTLVTRGYKSVATDGQALASAARMDKWRPEGTFRTVLETLRGPDTEVKSAVIVAVEFFRLLWLESLLPGQRDALCHAVLDGLVNGRQTREVIPLLRRDIEQAFWLLPIQKNDVDKVVALWATLRPKNPY
jgi:nucleoside phosphorylase